MRGAESGGLSMSTLETYTVRIYMAGDIETAKRWLRHEVWREGLCVTVEPTTFIYTGGEEEGFVVGLINYPRFPSDPASILIRARIIAAGLVSECAQRSALVLAPDVTEWTTRDPADVGDLQHPHHP